MEGESSMSIVEAMTNCHALPAAKAEQQIEQRVALLRNATADALAERDDQHAANFCSELLTSF
jgi:hypothetical protein